MAKKAKPKARIVKVDIPEMKFANENYGGAKAHFHDASYAFERGCQKLKALLAGNHWRECGSNGFTDVDAFLASLQLDEFAKNMDTKKEIAKLIKELRPEIPTRAIGRAVGLNKSTAQDALPGNRAAKGKKENQNNKASPGNRAPEVAGAAAAKWAGRKEGAGDRRDERLEKLAEIAKGNATLGIDVRYPVIYADPPWRYENPPMGATNRSIENHYPTMTLEEIRALPVSELATDAAVLYLWATAPKLAECLSVMEAWGFEYRTCAVWDKEVIGMGYYFRNQHELLLVGKRGDIPTPQPGEQPSSVYRERRGEHSAKPVYYYEMIEKVYPTLQKIELFARSPREGWSAWGNQAAALVETVEAAAEAAE